MNDVRRVSPRPLARFYAFCLVAAVLTGPLSGCNEAPAGPSGPPPAPTVGVATPVVRQIVEWDRYQGRLQAVQEVDVRAKVSGYLREIHFTDGQIVEEGDLLFVIDPRPFESEVARAEAAVQDAEAGRERAVAEVAQAKAGVRQSEASFELARTQQARTARLSRQGAVPDADTDVRESELKQAEADVEASQAAVALAEAAVKVAEAQIATAKSNLRTANIQLGYTRIAAPIGGRVSEHTVSVGNLVEAGGAVPLTTIVSEDPIHVVIEANEREFLKYMRLGRSGERPSSRVAKNPVLLGLLDEEGFPHEGHMDFVDNAVDQATGTMRGRAILPNGDGVLTPGLFARVRLPGSAPYEATLIPDAAVGIDQTQDFVYVVADGPPEEADTESAPDGAVWIERRPVTLGPEALGLRVVRDGLEPDDRIVVSGLQSLRPGMAVVPEEATIEADETSALPTEYEPWPEERWLSAGGEGLRESRRQPDAAD